MKYPGRGLSGRFLVLDNLPFSEQTPDWVCRGFLKSEERLMFILPRNTRRSGYIPEGKTEVIKKSKGNQIRCTSGILWVTIEGDSRDFRLSPLQDPFPTKEWLSSAVLHPIRFQRSSILPGRTAHLLLSIFYANRPQALSLGLYIRRKGFLQLYFYGAISEGPYAYRPSPGS